MRSVGCQGVPIRPNEFRGPNSKSMHCCRPGGPIRRSAKAGITVGLDPTFCGWAAVARGSLREKVPNSRTADHFDQEQGDVVVEVPCPLLKALEQRGKSLIERR